MNCVNLVGRLTRDPQQIGSMVAFGIAVRRDYKNKNGQYESDFPSCKIFGKAGEYALKYLKKGDMVSVVGSLATGKWTDQKGETHYSTDVVVRSVNNLSPRQTDQQTGFPVTEDNEFPFR